MPSTLGSDSWTKSHGYDLMEIYGDTRDLGYSYSYFSRRDEILRLVTETLPPPARVLDVAGAQGNFSLLLAEHGYDITWNDLRADLEDYVRSKSISKTIRFAPGNIFEVEGIGEFDLVLAAEIVEHVAHPDHFIQRMAELVKPGGYIVLTTPNGSYFRNQLPAFSDCPDPSVFEARQFQPDADGHIFLLHPGETASLAVKAGLRIKEMRLFANALTAGRLGSRSVLPAVPFSLVKRFEEWTQTWPMGLRCHLHTQMAILIQRPHS